jgi:hypothetical protein
MAAVATPFTGESRLKMRSTVTLHSAVKSNGDTLAQTLRLRAFREGLVLGHHVADVLHAWRTMRGNARFLRGLSLDGQLTMAADDRRPLVQKWCVLLPLGRHLYGRHDDGVGDSKGPLQRLSSRNHGPADSARRSFCH